MTTIEHRDISSVVRLERRGRGDPQLVGYAAVFNRDGANLGGFVESVAPGAFAESIRDDDVIAIANHDPSKVLGRTSAKTLRLREDTTGLRMEVDLPDTTDGRDLAELVGRGDIRGASFGFRTIDDKWETKDGEDHRTLLRVELVEVGPTAFPAYPDTSVAMRSLVAWRRRTSLQHLKDIQAHAQAR